jgi:hypothetical protein
MGGIGGSRVVVVVVVVVVGGVVVVVGGGVVVVVVCGGDVVVVVGEAGLDGVDQPELAVEVDVSVVGALCWDAATVGSTTEEVADRDPDVGLLATTVPPFGGVAPEWLVLARANRDRADGRPVVDVGADAPAA